MPTFDFKCTECKLVFEELVLKADELVECPNCKSARVVKLLISKTAPSVHFKGTGWYKSEIKEQREE